MQRVRIGGAALAAAMVVAGTGHGGQAASGAGEGPAVVDRAGRLLAALGRNDESSREALAELPKLGKGVAARLVAILEQDPGWSRRWDACEVLGGIGDPETIPAVAKRVVEDVESHVRWRCLYNLSRFEPDGKTSRELFAAGLASTDLFRRWNAAVGLAFFADRRAVEAIHQGLRSEDGWRRWEATSAVRKVHDARTSALLGSLLAEDPDPSIRQEAAMSLGSICDATATALLAEALASPVAGIRWRAALGLGRCGAREFAEAMRKRLEAEPDAEVRQQLEEAMKEIARVR